MARLLGMFITLRGEKLEVLDLKRPEQMNIIFFLFSDLSLKRRLLKLRFTEDGYLPELKYSKISIL